MNRIKDAHWLLSTTYWSFRIEDSRRSGISPIGHRSGRFRIFRESRGSGRFAIASVVHRTTVTVELAYEITRWDTEPISQRLNTFFPRWPSTIWSALRRSAW
jgi:hypothetical protein